jgi:H+/Cl- antiporter ClcA
VIAVKIISSTFKVLGGGVVGREGPTIQISSSVFQVVYKYLPKWWKPISQKNILVAGAASGLAAAFNTPLGGIIFAIEELSKFHIKKYKSSLFVAVIIAGLVAQSLGGSYLYLGYPKLATTGWMIYLGVLIVSILSGFFGAKIGAILWKVVTYLKSKKTIYQQIFIVLLASLLISSMIYFLGTDAMGSGKELMERTLFTADKNVEWYLPFVRMGGLITSFGFGGAGGIFAPSLSIGASIGAVVSGFLDLTGSNVNVLIVVGMTAFLTGITRSPFTSAIIVIEMTDRHSAIFFLMLAAVISSAIAYLVERKSFYDYLKDYYTEAVKDKTT